MSGHYPGDPCLIAALLCQYSPGDARQLVGERGGEDVGMQALSSANKPESEAVLGPVRWSYENNPGGLHEERSQISVAALGYAPEDGTVPGRHLIRDKAEPSCKIPPSREGHTIADRSNHRA